MNINLQIVPILWRHEWIQLRRQPLILTLFLFFLLLGIYSINNGKKMAAKQVLVIDSLHKIQDANLKAVIDRFRADTSTAKGKLLAKQAGIPQVIEFRNPPYAIYPPKALSALAIGQRNLLPFFDLVNTKRTNLTPPDLEISNPEKLAAGNFDLAFVFIYLFPLLIIVWCHNILSGEKEQQTDRLLQVHGISIRMITLGKITFRCLLICALALLMSLIGFEQTQRVIGINLTDASLWLLATLAYLAFWLAVSMLIALLNFSSRQNALFLLGIWLLLAVLIPATLARIADLAYPATNRADLDTKARNVTYETWEMPIPTLIDSFYTYNPAYQSLRQVTDTAQYGNKRFVAYQDLLQRRLHNTAEPFYRQNAAHYRFLYKLYWFDPVVLIDHILTADAETTPSDYAGFERQVNIFQQEYATFMNQYLLRDRQIVQKELTKLPRFSLQPDPEKTHRLLYSLIPISLQLLGLVACALFIKIKN